MLRGVTIAKTEQSVKRKVMTTMKNPGSLLNLVHPLTTSTGSSSTTTTTTTTTTNGAWTEPQQKRKTNCSTFSPISTSSSDNNSVYSQQEASHHSSQVPRHHDDYNYSSSLERTLDTVLEMIQLGKEPSSSSAHWEDVVRSTYYTTTTATEPSSYSSEDVDRTEHLGGVDVETSSGGDYYL